jgi:hypothetical protein
MTPLLTISRRNDGLLRIHGEIKTPAGEWIVDKSMSDKVLYIAMREVAEDVLSTHGLPVIFDVKL